MWTFHHSVLFFFYNSVDKMMCNRSWYWQMWTLSPQYVICLELCGQDDAEGQRQHDDGLLLLVGTVHRGLQCPGWWVHTVRGPRVLTSSKKERRHVVFIDWHPKKQVSGGRISPMARYKEVTLPSNKSFFGKLFWWLSLTTTCGLSF